MKNLLLVFVVLLRSALPCLALGDYNTQWQKGNNFYQQKQYDSAAFYFEQIAALKPQNAGIYYNLGNSYYRLNKIALAVLNYERALQINPDYKEAKDNLTLAQSRISNHIPTAGDIFFINWWQTITKAGNATAWAIAALVAFTLLIVLILLKRFHKGSRSLPVQVNGLLAFIFACFILLAFIASKNNEQNARAVVMESDAPLMSADLKGKPIMLVPEGTAVKVMSEKEGWLEVRLPDGRTGWLQQSLISKI